MYLAAFLTYLTNWLWNSFYYGLRHAFQSLELMNCWICWIVRLQAFVSMEFITTICENYDTTYDNFFDVKKFENLLFWWIYQLFKSKISKMKVERLHYFTLVRILKFFFFIGYSQKCSRQIFAKHKFNKSHKWINLLEKDKKK